MFRPRVIPVLLLKNLGLVKSIRFKDFRYIGDPINAVKLFNDLGADELAFLDILASHEKRTIPIDFVKRVGDEANMPFSIGGGITKIHEIRDLLSAGAEKVIINSFAAANPEFVSKASSEFGSSTITVSLDVKKNFFGNEYVYTHAGKTATKYDPVSYAILMEKMGAGEIIVNSIDHDGMMKGYDINLIKRVSEAVRIPVVGLGGAGSLNDIKEVINQGYASAAAAGSIFIYQGPRKAVLINYPSNTELIKLFTEL